MIDNVCLCCNKKLRIECSITEMIYVDDVICKKCREKLNFHPKKIKIDKYKVYGMYPYMGFTREMMIQYKEYNDEALKSIFIYKQIKELQHKFKGFVMVPAASSKESLERRGFNQVVEMFSYLGLPVRNVLVKTQNVSQKELPYNERRNISKSLTLINSELIEGKKVLLVDDILTTGSTLLASIKLLEPHCDKVCVVTACYNKSYLNELERLMIKWNI